MAKAKKKKEAQKQYGWRTGEGGFGVPAAVVGPELDRIKTEHDDILRPRDVVEEARPDEAPLHPAFEWNDPKAAELYREDQARRIIRSLVVVEKDPDTEEKLRTPVYLHVATEDEPNRQQYRSTDEVMQTPSLRKRVLAEAVRQAKAWQKRYERLSELAGVFAGIDQVAAALDEDEANAVKDWSSPES